jgi:hypothetical protein
MLIHPMQSLRQRFDSRISWPRQQSEIIQAGAQASGCQVEKFFEISK